MDIIECTFFIKDTIDLPYRRAKQQKEGRKDEPSWEPSRSTSTTPAR